MKTVYVLKGLDLNEAVELKKESARLEREIELAEDRLDEMCAENVLGVDLVARLKKL